MFEEVRNGHGERLDLAFHEGDAKREEIWVLGHGVTANKDRPFLTALADGLAGAGVAVLRFSFSGNGDSEGRFEDSTISKEVDDLGAVLDAVTKALPGWKVGYAGHSMGGAVGVLRAARDDRIQHLVSLAGMVHTEDFCARKFGDVEPGRGHMWDKPECPLSQAYVDDMKQIHSVVELGAKIRVPWLLVHGSDDTVVPPTDARDIVAKAGANAKLVELDGVDHVFNDSGCARMVETVVPWIAREPA